MAAKRYIIEAARAIYANETDTRPTITPAWECDATRWYVTQYYPSLDEECEGTLGYYRSRAEAEAAIKQQQVEDGED